MKWLKRLLNFPIDDEEYKKNIPKDAFITKVDSKIEKCKIKKKEYTNDLAKLHKWSNKLILDIFDVPSKFWYNELNNYEKIKKLPKNKKIANHIIKKTNNIIKEYKEQIELKKNKIIFCNESLNKYAKLISDYKLTLKKLELERQKKEKYNKLEEHSQRINRINEKNNLSEQSEKLTIDFLQEDIDELNNELTLQEEIYNQLDKLYQKYGNKQDYSSTKLFNSEIKKLIQND